jgi:uncharacterized protein (UPF0332 family)
LSNFDFKSVKKQPADFRQINMILQKAGNSLVSSEAILKDDPESAFTLAYESMLKASMALMFSRGLRPRVQLGHHKTLINFAKYALGDDSANMTATYDKMRGKRNRVVYDTGAVSKIEAIEGLNTAKKYLAVIVRKIAEENPQMKLL